jgi:hypothetical protein
MTLMNMPHGAQREYAGGYFVMGAQRHFVAVREIGLRMQTD